MITDQNYNSMTLNTEEKKLLVSLLKAVPPNALKLLLKANDSTVDTAGHLLNKLNKNLSVNAKRRRHKAD